ncbi:Hypothetical protein NTJ_02177 [Nesidiocoris tenuis]|uniref:Uncharacterized protein n=1 Tax=Nesidiocoris tenuis TaxID=355587 RepID=A0ABN7AET5_9HEMI|nr:Hypothetical protein NTJ_02177 [Nesidiocoris tenuis]
MRKKNSERARKVYYGNSRPGEPPGFAFPLSLSRLRALSFVKIKASLAPSRHPRLEGKGIFEKLPNSAIAVGRGEERKSRCLLVRRRHPEKSVRER